MEIGQAFSLQEPAKKGEQNPSGTMTTSLESSPKKRRRVYTLAQK